MGKKSKRREIKKSQSIDECKRIEETIIALDNETIEFQEHFLHSQAGVNLSEMLSLLEAKKDILEKHNSDFYIDREISFNERILMFETLARNFQAVVAHYKSAMTTTATMYFFYNLALVVAGKQDPYRASEAVLKRIDSDRSFRLCEEMSAVNWHMFLVELRRMKKWDEALDFTNKFGRYIEESKYCGLSFMYAVTYIERYRVEARKRPKDKRNWMSVSLYKHIFSKIKESCEQLETNEEVLSHPYRALLFGQWTYLNFQDVVREKGNGRDAAVFSVGNYIEAQHDSDFAMLYCQECRQKSTTSDPLLICSGCRAVCYCCIDHQRSSWKNEREMGVGIGHKMTCPLHKAFRKMKAANEGNKENVDDYNKRFRNECEKFLSDSLGLKDLCFPQKFIDEHLPI